MPLLRGEGLSREAVYWHYPHYSNQGGPPASAIREGDYKLIEFLEGPRVEIFNLKDDPGEQRNLARTEKRKLVEMRARLRQWRSAVDAAMPKLNPHYDPAHADQGLTGVEPQTPEI